LGSLTVITGVSGSGKSSLAFGTLYAEGQRRYVTSLSTYARQFLERLPRPDVDFVSNLPPAISIERSNRVTNARSTVGTATEILDYLRLLFSHAGETRCPDCDLGIAPGSVEAVSLRVAERFAGTRVQIGVPLPRRKGESPGALRERLAAEGYPRLLDGAGRVSDVTELRASELRELRSDGLVLLDRLALGAVGEAHARIAEAVATAFRREGVCVVAPVEGERVTYKEGFACDGCGRCFQTPVPPLFSFNSPLGACDTCQGFGRVAGLDRERVIPDEGKSLAKGAVAPFQTPSGQRHQLRLLEAAAEAGVPVDVPVQDLPARWREWIFQGDDAWRGVKGYFERLERKRYKVQNRILIARHRRFDPCPDCEGTRLCDDARAVSVAGCSLPELCGLTLQQLADWLGALVLPQHAGERVGRLLEDLRARVSTTVEVGLDYMPLDRPMRTLSGGEAQRIQLATALGGNLTSSLYVLDEPSIGLHARDVGRLIEILRRIRDQGNTVIVVEHALEIVSAADHIIDLGPGAGRLGGRVVAEGDAATLRAHAASRTGQAMRGEVLPSRTRQREPRGAIRIRGASENNLRNVDIDVPLGQLVVFSGVSGAGKSTLVGSVLVGNLLREPERGACVSIEGAEQVSEVVRVESNPPARSPRSNPATLSKAFEGIRKRFAASREAQRLGLAPGWFSFNVKGGRCDVCEGAGEVVVDMHFLDDLRMPCEACDGLRYRREALEIRVSGRNIVEVLELPVADARELFRDDRKIAPRLEPLERVGLGYLTLGQPLSTLSGGEMQRLRIAQALAEGTAGALYVLDEPTTGLHATDVAVLLECLDDLLEGGASVLVVEHNLDVICRADHVIDVGPEGGPGGGQIVVVGTPAEVMACEASRTGAALRGDFWEGDPGPRERARAR
jgi:excinuclease ABC subunit A